MTTDTREAGFHVVAEYVLAVGTEPAVLADLAELAAASRTEPANISYEFFRGVEDPSRVVIIERYTDSAGFDAHLSSAHFETIARSRIIPQLNARTVRTFAGTGKN